MQWQPLWGLAYLFHPSLVLAVNLIITTPEGPKPIPQVVAAMLVATDGCLLCLVLILPLPNAGLAATPFSPLLQQVGLRRGAVCVVRKGAPLTQARGLCASWRPPKTYGHLDLAFLSSSEGDGLGRFRKNVRLPKIMFGVGVICMLIALAMVNELKLGVENIIEFMFWTQSIMMLTFHL